MGNSAGSGFEVLDRIDYPDKHWVVNKGVRKEGDKDAVTLFSFQKKGSQNTSIASNCIKRMKTLRHPFILSYIESAETEESFALVTESCEPLEVWLKSKNILITKGINGSGSSNSVSTTTTAAADSEDNALILEILWGIRGIIDALQFLHNNQLAHNYLGLHAIFVAKSGDWKLGALDLVANLSNEDDFNLIKMYGQLLERPYLPPEKQQVGRGSSKDFAALTTTEQGKSSQSQRAVGSEGDIFALTHCIQAAFNKIGNGNNNSPSGLEVPNSLTKYFARMLSVDPKKRPSAAQLLKVPVFNSSDIKLLLSLGELAALKPAKESLDVLEQLADRVTTLPKPICEHKILPRLGDALQMASNDFVNRDARESCRQTIQLWLI